MTQLRVRWSSVLLGFGLTFLIAITPILYLVVSGPSPDGNARTIAGDHGALEVTVNHLTAADGSRFVLLIGAIAVMVVLGAIAVFSRSQRYTA